MNFIYVATTMLNLLIMGGVAFDVSNDNPDWAREAALKYNA